jgi:kinesin family protein 6/9
MRGIIPRALTFLFDELEKRNDLGYLNNLVCEVTISFMEIYNENAYDLLDKKHLELPLE